VPSFIPSALILLEILGGAQSAPPQAQKLKNSPGKIGLKVPSKVDNMNSFARVEKKKFWKQSSIHLFLRFIARHWANEWAFARSVLAVGPNEIRNG